MRIHSPPPHLTRCVYIYSVCVGLRTESVYKLTLDCDFTRRSRRAEGEFSWNQESGVKFTPLFQVLESGLCRYSSLHRSEIPIFFLSSISEPVEQRQFLLQNSDRGRWRRERDCRGKGTVDRERAHCILHALLYPYTYAL